MSGTLTNGILHCCGRDINRIPMTQDAQWDAFYAAVKSILQLKIKQHPQNWPLVNSLLLFTSRDQRIKQTEISVRETKRDDGHCVEFFLNLDTARRTVSSEPLPVSYVNVRGTLCPHAFISFESEKKKTLQCT
ncbi:hypothetical protein CEXT_3091 [Caerostris extrusa]|uniref:Uncharacterized protein n=1 Tax=Caerostris extrusa TaxID=172846 RepID=A0AAV4WIW9_CAEEX|nr:hypothetical protein CEXT_3091 [Caerostris extrusa]